MLSLVAMLGQLTKTTQHAVLQAPPTTAHSVTPHAHAVDKVHTMALLSHNILKHLCLRDQVCLGLTCRALRAPILAQTLAHQGMTKSLTPTGTVPTLQELSSAVQNKCASQHDGHYARFFWRQARLYAGGFGVAGKLTFAAVELKIRQLANLDIIIPIFPNPLDAAELHIHTMLKHARQQALEELGIGVATYRPPPCPCVLRNSAAAPPKRA